MSNHYAEVIDLLTCGTVDYKRIAIELAKTSPSLFLRLHYGADAKPLLSADTICEIRSFIVANQLISAIKSLRAATVSDTTPHGMSLKDSRDIIFIAAGREQIFITPDLQKYVDEIRS